MQNVSFKGATIMINNMEFGYTPTNLKGLRQKIRFDATTGRRHNQVSTTDGSAVGDDAWTKKLHQHATYKWLELLQFIAQG